MKRLFLAIVVSVSVVSCADEDAPIQCVQSADCPRGLVCREDEANPPETCSSRRCVTKWDCNYDEGCTEKGVCSVSECDGETFLCHDTECVQNICWK